MTTAGRVSFTRAVLLLGVVAFGLWLLSVELAVVGGGGKAADPAVRAAVAGRRTHAQAAVRSPDAWRTREWRRGVDRHAAVLRRHLADGMLAASSVAVCLGGAQEAMALRELGVVGAVAVAKERSPPLAVAGNDRNLPFPDSSVDFVFAGRALDFSKRQADLASEAARIVKPDGHGHLVVLTSGASDAYSLRSLQALLPSLRLLRSRVINGADGSTLRELVFRKHAGISTTNGNNFAGSCTSRDHKLEIIGLAEPLIQEEPAKPWITLKRNIKNIRYLPALAGIGFKRRYVYVDVGARSYGSSIGSWFRKQYPKQNHTFEVFAVEADPAFHADYARKKGVTLLPYAAWVRNETLTFEINDGPGSKKGDADDVRKPSGRGMGRIRTGAGAMEGVSSGEVRRIPAFDLAEWLKRTASEQDYVVMKMDVEGTEFDLIPRMLDTGAICLVDELFLECHYNRWQRCCPGERSPKYRNTYGECLQLFNLLRNSGVLVHQWW
jgi:FkbM family methyltransferase